jgi:hypothetical protein
MKLGEFIGFGILAITAIVYALKDGYILLLLPCFILLLFFGWIVKKGEKIIHEKEQYWEGQERIERLIFSSPIKHPKDSKGLFLVILGYALIIADIIGFIIGASIIKAHNFNP